jgi:two-component system phosphate regulon sensor histidine kinase PhoR
MRFLFFRTFRTKLLASHVALVVAVVLIVILELNRSLGADLARQLDQRLEQQAQGAAQWVSEGRRHPEKLAGRLGHVVNADVSIFDREGNILGDSAATGASLASGPMPSEVEAAHRGEVGHATRTLPGTNDEIHYVAVLAGDGIVVRLSAPLSAMRRRLLFASAVAIAAAIALGFLASRIASRPLRDMTASATRIAKGDYDIALSSTSPDEFGVLAEALSSLASQLKARIGDLTAERDRLSAILAGMVEGVLVLGADGRVVVANPAAAEIVGGEDPLVGKRLEDAVTRVDLRAFLASASKSDEVREAEIEAEGRSIALYVRPLAASAGGVVTVLRDMTGLRKLMTMRRDFVANVSHELRTPVAAIQGYAETLLGDSADVPTRKEFMEIIHRQAQRIGALVEDLLRLSELEARGPDQAVRESVDVGAIAGHVVQTVRERAATRTTTLALDVPNGVVAHGDPSGVEQILLNLVDNAIKYGKDGGRVAIDARRDGDRVVMTVADDGPGIDARHLPRLFERFYRVDDGRARERGGTGLGLAIVKHVVEAMGGAVRVESDAGKGTRFVVELPAQPIVS